MCFPRNENYYFYSMRATLGYNWKEPHACRFWTVNARPQSEIASQTVVLDLPLALKPTT